MGKRKPMIPDAQERLSVDPKINGPQKPDKLSDKELKATALEQLKQIELNAKVQELLNNLRNKASIKYFTR